MVQVLFCVDKIKPVKKPIIYQSKKMKSNLLISIAKSEVIPTMISL